MPTAPAPSTAGGLTGDALTPPDGWSPTAKPGSPEEGYLGNGTWVHAMDARHAAFGAIALGCTDLRDYPVPVAALEGTLANAEGRPGVGLALEFASPDDAVAYFAEWRRQAEACVAQGGGELVTATSTSWSGRRTVVGSVWSERVVVDGSRVRLLIVDGPLA